MGMAVEGPYILPNNIPQVVDPKTDAEVCFTVPPLAMDGSSSPHSYGYVFLVPSHMGTQGSRLIRRSRTSL